ncbi:MAG: pilus assembly protein CpaA [Lacrimispora sp.]|uniref:prepilin peptidase n=1 Tax=Lacrimispora sp. TaxID=2719234 RepID=UPI0039E53982
MLESINKIAFGVFLLLAAWQDGREKHIRVWLLASAGLAGIFLSFLRADFGMERLLSCLIGAGLLMVSRLTDEAIGSGDGWFFTVSGFYLTPVLNLKLLIYGTFLSGFVCGGIYLYSRLKGRDVRKKPVAFLPFLVPVWIGLVAL